MINEPELNAIKGVLHFLNYNDNGKHDLAFDINVVDSNGETVARIARQSQGDYQLLFGDGR